MKTVLFSLLFTSPSYLNTVDAWVGGRMRASHHTNEVTGELTPVEVPGFFGQNCSPDSGDFPAMCPTTGQTAHSQHGKIECIHNFDCCTCGAMICGTPAEPDCTMIVCNGDSGCYGVKNMQISGDAVDGAAINCNGDLSCMETRAIGTNIGSVLCTGDGSCAYSNFHLGCIKEGCPVSCVGDNSCQADPVDPALSAEYIIVNSLGLTCASHACGFAKFNLMSNVGGGIVCGAERACESAMITANNMESLTCGGMWACLNANILIVNPQNGFTLTCQSRQSCYNASIEIIITDPEITSFMAISFNGVSSGENAVLTISKVIPPGTAIVDPASPNLEIGELVCGAAKSCYNAQFDFTPNVIVAECACAGGATQACEGLSGVDSCVQGLARMECVGTGCQNMVETITNPQDYFQLICADPGSCEGFTLTININHAPNAPTILGGVTCGAPSACKGLRLFILNSGPTRVDAGSVTCGSSMSCANTAFVLRQADFSGITCAAGDSCDQCAWFTDNIYSPCDQPAV